MKQTVSVETRRELCAAIAVRYRTADRQSKKLVLDEFVKITGYHRKHAIRLLRKGAKVNLEIDMLARYVERMLGEKLS